MADRSEGAGRSVAPSASSLPDAARSARSYDTTQLFGPESEVEITHQGTAYRLKITRQGKLILNK
jgi:hemin uptake protein HemP